MGKEEAILEALGKIPGVQLTPESYLHSNGILGLICAGVEHPEAVLDRVAGMTSEIQSRIARRAIVFPTGFELKQGLIEDTNTPFLKGLLEEKGYTVTVGEIMEDDLADICDTLDDALSYKGKVVSIRRSDAHLPDGEYFTAELLGLTVLDAETGEDLGKLSDVIPYPGHDVYVVSGKKEFMVPAVPAFIGDIDMDRGTMEIHVWEGLI